MAIVTLCKNVVFCIIYIMHKDDEQTIIDNGPHLRYFSWRDRFSRVLGILSYVHVFKKEIGVINSTICGFYSLTSYASNLVKITPVVSEAENTKTGKTDSNSSPEWPCWLENRLIEIWYPVVKFLKHFYMYLSIAHNVLPGNRRLTIGFFVYIKWRFNFTRFLL